MCTQKDAGDQQVDLQAQYIQNTHHGQDGHGKDHTSEENYTPDEEHLLPHTTEVTPYEHAHDKIDFTFFDTPGFQDEADGANDYNYLKDMVQNNQEPDLIIFTIKMDDKFREEDAESIKEITNAFGWKVWKHAMFVLTFANKVSLPDASVKSWKNKVSYNRIQDEFALNVTNLLQECKVQEEVINNIPIIPVGLVSQPIIPSDSRQESWLKEFWQAVNARLKASKLDEPEVKNNPCTCPVCECPMCECPAKNTLSSGSGHTHTSISFFVATVVIAGLGPLLFCYVTF